MDLDPRFRGLPRRELESGVTLIEATTRRARLRGLGGIASLPLTQALRIPVRSVHTATMRFPLDLIWLDAGGRILRVDRDVSCWRIRTCLRARSVIEVSAGGADALVDGLKVPPAR